MVVVVVVEVRIVRLTSEPSLGDPRLEWPLDPHSISTSNRYCIRILMRTGNFPFRTYHLEEFLFSFSYRPQA